MMKTSQLLFLVLLSTYFPIASLADVWQDPETKVNYMFTPGQSEAKVKGGDEMEGMWSAGSPEVSGAINIRSNFTVDGSVYTVTAIGDGAFTWCTNMVAVSIPSTVTKIGNYSFSYCRGLTSIIIPNSVTDIGENAFESCIEVSSLTLGNSVKNIGTSAFFGLHKLSSLIIPNSVINIGDRAFESCFHLMTVLIPSSVKSIGVDAFYSCSSLTFVCVDDLAAWCNIDFCGGTASNPLYYSNSIYVLHPEGTITPVLDDPLNMTEINEHRYLRINELIIPNSVTFIGNYAFSGCTLLYSVTIPNSVTSIGDEAFFSCDSLTSVSLPSTLDYIGTDAFWSTKWYERWYNSHEPGLLYMDNYLFGYKDSKPTGEFIINEGTRTIVGNAFYGCSGITSVVIPNSVIGIGNRAFYACTNMTSVNIPNSVTRLGDQAFAQCAKLSSITIPNSVKSIGYSAFFNCNNITDVFSNILEPFDIEKNVFECWNGYYSFTNATLHVPAGTKTLYEATEGWKEFKKIVEDEDDEWIRGDVNLDGRVNGTDIVALVNVIMGQTVYDNADVNGDDKINGTDLVALVNIIMNSSQSQTKMAASRSVVGDEPFLTIGAEPVLISTDGSRELTITLNNPQMEVTMVQMDVTLPEGLSLCDNTEMLAGRTSSSTHQLQTGKVDEHTVRLLLASSKNALIDGIEGGIIRLKLKANDDFEGGDIVLSNMLCTSPDLQEAWPQAVTLNLANGGTTGITKNENGRQEVEDYIYDLQGRRVKSQIKRKGVNIIGGQKILK